MKITDAQIEQFKRNGYLLVEGFLNPEEARDAREGFNQHFAPDWDTYVANGHKNPIERAAWLFPWDHSGLNHAVTHPNLIDFASRLHGTDDLRLCEAHLGAKYAGEDHWQAWHIDYGNNTLSPEITDLDETWRYLTSMYYFTDVTRGTAPVRMRRHGAGPDEYEDITGPAGSVCFYSLYTWHTATEFLDPTGYRATAWVNVMPANRPMDFARTFTYKSGASVDAMSRFIRDASPAQLSLLGFPPPGDPFWTESYIAGMEQRYPGFDGNRYRQRMAVEAGA